MKQIISLSDRDLNNIILLTLSSLKIKDPYFYPLFKIMHLTGCRLEEALNRAAWNIKATNLVTLKTVKNNHIRIIDETNSDDIATLINLLQNHYYTTSQKSNVLKIANLYLNQYNIYHQNKKLTTSIFRHNYIKKLKAKGKTDNEIKSIMGHIQQDNTNNYIYSELLKIS
jgi:integrase